MADPRQASADQAPKIVVVIDGTRVHRDLVEALVGEHYDVRVVDAPAPGTGSAGLGEPDLVVVDAPLTDRGELCTRVRQVTPAPIMVIGQPGAEDAADCLDRGADDYLARPDRPREWVARVRAHLRRRRPVEPPASTIRSGQLLLDPDAHEVRVKGRPVTVTATQFRLLELMLANPGRVVTHSIIAERVWGQHWVSPNAIQAQMARLRHALGDAETAARVRAVPGIGYTLSPA
ncbi:MAG TPA: response regulator transcription factor [Acidimicrobiales bacterium]|nr:response regulator transcription factor [Acidimicrobiales bacterium]